MTAHVEIAPLMTVTVRTVGQGQNDRAVASAAAESVGQKLSGFMTIVDGHAWPILVYQVTACLARGGCRLSPMYPATSTSAGTSMISKC